MIMDTNGQLVNTTNNAAVIWTHHRTPHARVCVCESLNHRSFMTWQSSVYYACTMSVCVWQLVWVVGSDVTSFLCHMGTRGYFNLPKLYVLSNYLVSEAGSVLYLYKSVLVY